jgi:hypothetical protein
MAWWKRLDDVTVKIARYAYSPLVVAILLGVGLIMLGGANPPPLVRGWAIVLTFVILFGAISNTHRDSGGGQ